MMRLLRAELARIRSRQMTWIIAAAATAMLALISGSSPWPWAVAGWARSSRRGQWPPG